MNFLVQRLKKIKKLCFYYLLPMAVPAMLQACPRCVDATPYKMGMQWAVVVLLPVPIVLAGALFFWIRGASKSDGSDS